MSGSQNASQADLDALTGEVADLQTEVNTLKSAIDALSKGQPAAPLLLDAPGDLTNLDNWIRTSFPGSSLEYQLWGMCFQFYGLPPMPAS